MDSNEPKIEVPLRLLKNLVDCIDAQKTLSSSNIDITSRQQMQTVIDNTKEWAKEVIQRNEVSPKAAANLQETLDFVQTDKSSRISVGTCDVENESSCTMIVEPDDPGGGFI